MNKEQSPPDHLTPGPSSPGPSWFSAGWLRKHRVTLASLSLIVGFWCFANYSGLPQIPRFNTEPPPPGSAVTKWVVYGWPIATDQEMLYSGGGGGSSSRTRGTGVQVPNVFFGILLMILTTFLFDWRRYRREFVEEQKVSGRVLDLEVIRKQRQVFQKKWLGIGRAIFAAVIMLMGVLILFGMAVSLQEFRAAAHAPYAETIMEISRKHEHGSSIHDLGWGGGSKLATSYLAIGMLVGTVFLIAGISLLVKRFSLRAALAAVFFAGAMGSVPFAFAPASYPTKALVSLGLDQNLPAPHVAIIRGLLQPPAAASTLPDGLKKELGLPNELDIREVSVQEGAQDGAAGIQMAIDFLPGANPEIRATVFRFCTEYFLQLATRAAKANGLTVPAGRSGFLGDSTWDRWKNSWLEAQKPELDRLFTTPTNP